MSNMNDRDRLQSRADYLDRDEDDDLIHLLRIDSRQSRERDAKHPNDGTDVLAFVCMAFMAALGAAAAALILFPILIFFVTRIAVR